jgi:hypothetical protein
LLISSCGIGLAFNGRDVVALDDAAQDSNVCAQARNFCAQRLYVFFIVGRDKLGNLCRRKPRPSFFRCGRRTTCPRPTSHSPVAFGRAFSFFRLGLGHLPILALFAIIERVLDGKLALDAIEAIEQLTGAAKGFVHGDYQNN